VPKFFVFAPKFFGRGAKERAGFVNSVEAICRELLAAERRSATEAEVSGGR
jgi:hypothetical protein